VASVLPFGRWPSPLGPAELAAAKISRSDLRTDGRAAYWLESRPDERGRNALWRAPPGGPAEEITPPGADVRSRVHEYGGGAFCVLGGGDHAGSRVAAVDRGTQRITLFTPGADAVVLGPEPAGDPGPALGDLAPTADGRWVCAVREGPIPGGGGRRGRTLVAFSVDRPGECGELVAAGDFVVAPRPSADGRWLAFVSWDHPDMQWDRSWLGVAPLTEEDGRLVAGNPQRVAGGGGVSVGEPVWTRHGDLVFVADTGGWWQPWLAEVSTGGVVGPPRRLCAVPEEFHAPDWSLGVRTMAELRDGRLACCARADGTDRLAVLDPRTGELETLDQPCATVAGVVVVDDGVTERLVWLGRTPDGGPPRWTAVPGGPGAGAGGDVRPPALGPASISTGRHLSFAVPETHGAPGAAPGEVVPAHEAFAWYYEPRREAVLGPDDARPPLVVVCHGGPTGSADAGFDVTVQFFTSRGFAVAAVNYGGSTGYGRAYRQSLRGRWGLLDTVDCVAGARHLASAGLADPARLVIRGSSAGGLTALNALRAGGTFAAATAWYPVTDLSVSPPEHEFEVHYTEGLVGRLPEALATYRRRSPAFAVDEMQGSVLICQGLDDPVVPPRQAEELAAALVGRGADCTLLTFPGESHGFRQAATVAACIRAELDLYQRVLHLDPS
jgi:dienelactone hydrolase